MTDHLLPLKILLVDDEEYFRLFVRKVLSTSIACTIAEAHNGREAIAACQTSDPDLILLDIYMPELDGMQALPQIRALKPTTPIVMLTSDSEEAVVEQCVNLGASYFVRKDVHADQLQVELLNMLRMFFPARMKPHETLRTAPV